MLVFRRKNSHDADVADFLQALEKLPLLNVAVIDIDLAATTDAQEFAHGLNRPFVGVFVVGQNANVHVQPQLSSDTRNPSRVIAVKLAAATACRARVVVF